jgi:hypothetical protein
MSSVATRIKPIIVAAATVAFLGTAAVPFMTSAAHAAASATHISATPNDQPWPGR